jgi:hypothetical protein
MAHIPPNKPLEVDRPPPTLSSAPQTPCLPLRGSVRRLDAVQDKGHFLRRVGWRVSMNFAHHFSFCGHLSPLPKGKSKPIRSLELVMRVVRR